MRRVEPKREREKEKESSGKVRIKRNVVMNDSDRCYDKVYKTMREESGTQDERGGERKVKKRPWEEAAGLAVALRARLRTPSSSSSSSPCKQLRAFNWFTISVNDRAIYKEGRKE